MPEANSYEIHCESTILSVNTLLDHEIFAFKDAILRAHQISEMNFADLVSLSGQPADDWYSQAEREGPTQEFDCSRVQCAMEAEEPTLEADEEATAEVKDSIADMRVTTKKAHIRIAKSFIPSSEDKDDNKKEPMCVC